jgi:hypothetical protein
MKGFFIAVKLILFVCQVKAQNQVTFPSEFIDFIIDNNYFSINGMYTFRNTIDEYTNANILFPFAVKTALIDSIRIINMKNLKTIVYKKHEQYISFNLQMAPYDTIEVNIFYRQQLASKNSYILTTTKSWGTPLENAVYSLTTNKSLKILSLSLEPDSSKTDLYTMTYFWHKKNFTPQTDFEVIIEK